MAELVADYVLRRLKEWGVHRIYGYPGDGINAFLGALDRADGDPEIIQTRHEEMAAFMACGHAKFTQEVGVCMATSGPGAIHLLNGLYDAKLDHAPVVAIIGQQKRMSLGAGYQQEVDLQVLFKDVSEYVQYCMEPAQARHLVDAAVRHALDRKGVATLIFPADVQEEKAVPSPPRMHGSVYSSVGYSRPRVVPQDVDLHRAAALLNEGEKVAMLVGQGAAGAADEVTECAEKLGAGVAKALLGRSVLPDDLPFVTGPIGLLGSRASYELMDGCDTLLMVGTSFPYSEWLPEEGQAKCVQIDLDGRRVGMRYPVDVPLVGDAKETLRELLPLLEHKEDRSWREEVEEQVAEWWRVVEDLALMDADPVNPQRVIWELSKRLPEDAILAADSGSSTNWWARMLKLKRGNLASLSGTLATMGPGTPYAIAAKLAYPGPPGDRDRRRRRVPDERHERAAHGEALRRSLRGQGAARVLHLQEPGSQPGHLGAACAHRRSEVPGHAMDSGLRLRALRRAGRRQGDLVRRPRRSRRSVGRGARDDAARSCSR